MLPGWWRLHPYLTRPSAVTVRVSLAVPSSAPGAPPPQPPPPSRKPTGDARWLLLVADEQGQLQHVRRFSAAQLAQAPRGQLAFSMPMSAGRASAHLLHPEHHAVLREKWLDQLALWRLLSALDHASGCPKLRPASDNQPLRQL